MRCAYVKLVADNKILFMEPYHFDRYSSYPPFYNSGISLVVFDNVYINVFDLIFHEEEFLDCNSEAVQINEIPLSDICFAVSSVSSVAKSIGCSNFE